jgi:hypothetical protein
MHQPHPVQFGRTISRVGASSSAFGGQTPVQSPQRTHVSGSTAMIAGAVTVQAWAASADAVVP